MLPSTYRMRSSAEFSAVVRRGARARRGTVVVHFLAGASTSTTPQVGFVVGRPIGDSVTRHQVSRRLRAQMAARLGRLPASSATVVRALPEAAGAASIRLGRDLDAALDRLTGPAA